MRELIEQLKTQNELLIVSKEVNPKYELAAVTKAIQGSSNKTVLFDRLPIFPNSGLVWDVQPG